MKHVSKILALFLTLVLVLMPFSTASASEVIAAEGTDLSGYTVILHTNDSHGRAVPDSYGGNMGFTAVSALKKAAQKAGAEVILLDAGDTLHGLPFATLTSGESIVELMNLAGYDAMTPGNHDFNYGSETLKSLAATMDFPLLSSNVTLKASGSKFLESNTIIVKNGVKYGIFGVSTPETAYKTNPNNVSTLNFGNPIEAAKAEVASLQAAGADVIIALAHLGLDESSEFTSAMLAEQATGIDLIVDGHSHTILETGKTVDNTLIVSTGEYIKNIGAVVIDKEGKMSARLVNISQFTDTDEAVDKVVAEISAEQEEQLSEVVGSTSVYLDGVRENVRSKETNLGNLTADAMRDATGADVAFTNGGGIRASIEIGNITKKDLTTVFPFGNYVVTKKVTGKDILAAMEVGVASYPETLGAFPQVSGITFTIDASKPAGSRITNAKIGGVALDSNKTYLLASNDFIFAGGDGYTMFADIDVVNEYSALEEVLINYIQKLGKVDINTDGRIQVMNETPVEEPAEEEPVEEPAEEPAEESAEESPEEVEIYVVVKGDYLRKIAKALLGSESQWKKIYEWNKDIISNPDRIYIGQELKIYAE
ncbi:MAG: 5-Nucleotidase domain protein precursor [Lachnospiraceae bacterium]|nr:5-Nucleotidase domain protein precursor [Lachnospiraceae bacterium]